MTCPPFEMGSLLRSHRFRYRTFRELNLEDLDLELHYYEYPVTLPSTHSQTLTVHSWKPCRSASCLGALWYKKPHWSSMCCATCFKDFCFPVGQNHWAVRDELVICSSCIEFALIKISPVLLKLFIQLTWTHEPHRGPFLFVNILTIILLHDG